MLIASSFLSFILLMVFVHLTRSFRLWTGVKNVRPSSLHATVDLQVGRFDEEVTTCAQPVLVDFYANWCGPCKLMGPIFEQLSEEESSVKFVKVDTDVHEEAVDRFNIQGLPLFGLFVNGEMVSSHAGAMKKDALKDFVHRGLAKTKKA